MKKHKIILVFLLCMVLVSGCYNEPTEQTEIGKDKESITETDRNTDRNKDRKINTKIDRNKVEELDRELVFKFPEEDIQSLFVYTYDFEGNTTTSNWVYEKEDMTDFVNYLKNLSGKKVSNINPDDLSGFFYGVELSGSYPYTLLSAGEYAINYEGEYFLIDKEDAVKMCNSIIRNTQVHDTVYNIVNNRYLSLIDGKWNTKYMNKSIKTDDTLEKVQMIGDNKELHSDTELLKILIENTSSKEIEFGSRLELEALIDDSWYNIDNMINDNINLGWTDELYILEAGNSLDTVFHFTYFQPLPTGRYRLIKDISFNGNMGYTAFEFEVK